VIRNQDTGGTLRSLYAAQGGASSIFSTKATDYAASRPDYPAALFETLRAACSLSAGATVVDIGAGTGLLTQGLLRLGCRVTAIEPSREMRQASDLLLGGFGGYSSADGCAEAIPLEAASVDLITAAQAFHWFEIERARAEFLRVLKPQGQVTLIWNDRVLEDPLQGALDEVFAEFGGPKRAALVAHEDRSSVPRFFGSAQPKEFTWPHARCLGEDGLLSLVFSRSYMPERSSEDGRRIVERVRQIFSRFAADGKVEVRYRTVAFLGRPA
jgi:SAM-dependent methyltransferase